MKKSSHVRSRRLLLLAVLFAVAACANVVALLGAGNSALLRAQGTPSNLYAAASTITVKSPNGGESWPIGSTKTIKWTASSGLSGKYVTIHLWYYVGGVPQGYTIASVLASAGSYSWVVGATSDGGIPPIGSTFKISVFESSSGTVDYSNNNFSLTASSPFVTVLSPNGGEQWTWGNTCEVRWLGALISGNVSIYAVDDASATSYLLGTPAALAGTYRFTLGNTTSGTPRSSTKYKVKVMSSSTVYDFSNNYFSMSTILTTLPTISSPNGGESWVQGTSQTIRWSSNGNPNDTSISLYDYRNGYPQAFNVGGAPASAGTFTWTVGSTINSGLPPTGSQYKMVVCGGAGSCDYSNNYFSIANPPGMNVFGFGEAYMSKKYTPLSGDWNGDGITTIGLYDSESSTFLLRNSNTAGAADISFGFGIYNSGWLPLAGDWDGNGTVTIGLYNPSTSTFMLRNSNTTGMADVSFGFGAPGWKPIAGDWDGNGTTTIGLYDPSTSTFYLRNSNSTGNADIIFGFGAGGAGWLPIAGDWDGNRTTTIGLYDPAISTFYLRNSNTTGAADSTFALCSFYTYWKPVTGVWKSSFGKSATVGLYDLGSSSFYLKN